MDSYFSPQIKQTCSSLCSSIRNPPGQAPFSHPVHIHVSFLEHNSDHQQIGCDGELVAIL